MFSSRELTDALLLQRRKRRWGRASPNGSTPGEFPPGWKDWFASMQPRRHAVTGAPHDAFVDIFVQRELKQPPARSADLSAWATFNALWHPRWQRAESERESRRDRLAAIGITVVAHLLLLLLSLIPTVYPPAPSSSDAGDHVVQVEFIGEGTPEDTGGGAPQAEETQQEDEQASAATRPAPQAPSAAAAAVAQPAQPSAPVQQAQPEERPAQQPLQVTQTPVPDSTFVLPPTTPPELQVEPPRLRTPSLQAQQRQVELVEAPSAPALRPEVVPQAIPTPQVEAKQAQVRTREVPLLQQPQTMSALQQREPEVLQLSTPSRQVRSRELPLAAAAASESAQKPAEGKAAATPSAETGERTAATQSRSGGRPASSGGASAASSNNGKGANPSTPAGAWPAKKRGDDWGASDRNRPGGNAGTSGLFNADGSPRLAPGMAAAGGGFPPGSDDWSREQLDRYGTWSRNPPIGYTGTRFDQYWIPSGTLLEEWVRRGFKTMSIPIPGSSKKINCTISLLQLGGSCGVTDADMQDQEAIARPPPDIPYKSELQEGKPAQP